MTTPSGWRLQLTWGSTKPTAKILNKPKPLSDFTHVENNFLGGILTKPSHFIRSRNYNDGETIYFYFKSIKVRFLSRPSKGV